MTYFSNHFKANEVLQLFLSKAALGSNLAIFFRVLGVANYNSKSNSDLHRRYFGPRMPPIFVNSGGKTIKVTVGDTVTIPCKIHNKGKQFYLMRFV